MYGAFFILLLIPILVFIGWIRSLGYRRAARAGIVARATITDLSAAGGFTNGNGSLRVEVSVQQRDGSEIQTSFKEVFSPLHIRTIGDELPVFVDPKNAAIVYPISRKALERAKQLAASR